MYPFALQTGFPLPAGDGALIELEGGNDGLQWAAVGKQRHHCELPATSACASGRRAVSLVSVKVRRHRLHW